MPKLVIEVASGVVTAVYTDLDITVAVNDHDAGIEEGPVTVIPLTRGGNDEPSRR